jgi:hypothetical protein
MYPPAVQAILDHPKEMITATMLAPLIEKDPTTIRYFARHRPTSLPFPAIVCGNRVTFPKRRALIALGYLPEPSEE